MGQIYLTLVHENVQIQDFSCLIFNGMGHVSAFPQIIGTFETDV